MINLISQETKKKVATQYFLRLGTVSIIVMGIFLFLAFVLLIPSYFIAIQKENTEIVQSEELRNSEAFQENKELGLLVDITKEQLGVVSRIQPITISKQLIQPVLDYVNADTSNVKLSYIKYFLEEDSMLDIRGTTDSRDELLKFIEILKQDESFSKVEVPVSSFVQNTDISFHITLSFTQDGL